MNEKASEIKRTLQDLPAEDLAEFINTRLFDKYIKAYTKVMLHFMGLSIEETKTAVLFEEIMLNQTDAATVLDKADEIATTQDEYTGENIILNKRYIELLDKATSKYNQELKHADLDFSAKEIDKRQMLEQILAEYGLNNGLLDAAEGAQ